MSYLKDIYKHAKREGAVAPPPPPPPALAPGQGVEPQALRDGLDASVAKAVGRAAAEVLRYLCVDGAADRAGPGARDPQPPVGRGEAAAAAAPIADPAAYGYDPRTTPTDVAPNPTPEANDLRRVIANPVGTTFRTSKNIERDTCALSRGQHVCSNQRMASDVERVLEGANGGRAALTRDATFEGPTSFAGRVGTALDEIAPTLRPNDRVLAIGVNPQAEYGDKLQGLASDKGVYVDTAAIVVPAARARVPARARGEDYTLFQGRDGRVSLATLPTGDEGRASAVDVSPARAPGAGVVAKRPRVDPLAPLAHQSSNPTADTGEPGSTAQASPSPSQTQGRYAAVLVTGLGANYDAAPPLLAFAMGALHVNGPARLSVVCPAHSDLRAAPTLRAAVQAGRLVDVAVTYLPAYRSTGGIAFAMSVTARVRAGGDARGLHAAMCGEEGTVWVATGGLPRAVVVGDAALDAELRGALDRIERGGMGEAARDRFNNFKRTAKELGDMMAKAAPIRAQAETRANAVKDDVVDAVKEYNRVGAEGDPLFIKLRVPYFQRSDSTFAHAATIAKGEFVGMARGGERALAVMLAPFLDDVGGSFVDKGGAFTRILGDLWNVPSMVVPAAAAQVQLGEHLCAEHGEAGREAWADMARRHDCRREELERHANILARHDNLPDVRETLIAKVVEVAGLGARTAAVIDDVRNNIVPDPADPATAANRADLLARLEARAVDRKRLEDDERQMREWLDDMSVPTLKAMVTIFPVLSPRPSSVGITCPCHVGCHRGCIWYAMSGTTKAKTGNSACGPVRPLAQTAATVCDLPVGLSKWRAQGLLPEVPVAGEPYMRPIINAVESGHAFKEGGLHDNFAGQPSACTRDDIGLGFTAAFSRCTPGMAVLLATPDGAVLATTVGQPGKTTDMRVLPSESHASGVRSMRYTMAEDGTTPVLSSVMSSSFHPVLCVANALPAHGASEREIVASGFLRKDMGRLAGILFEVKKSGCRWTSLANLWRAVKEVLNDNPPPADPQEADVRSIVDAAVRHGDFAGHRDGQSGNLLSAAATALVWIGSSRPLGDVVVQDDPRHELVAPLAGEAVIHTFVFSSSCRDGAGDVTFLWDRGGHFPARDGTYFHVQPHLFVGGTPSSESAGDEAYHMSGDWAPPDVDRGRGTPCNRVYGRSLSSRHEAFVPTDDRRYFPLLTLKGAVFSWPGVMEDGLAMLVTRAARTAVRAIARDVCALRASGDPAWRACVPVTLAEVDDNVATLHDVVKYAHEHVAGTHVAGPRDAVRQAQAEFLARPGGAGWPPPMVHLCGVVAACVWLGMWAPPNGSLKPTA